MKSLQSALLVLVLFVSLSLAQPVQPLWLNVPDRVGVEFWNTPINLLIINDQIYLTVHDATNALVSGLQLAHYGADGELSGSDLLDVAVNGFGRVNLHPLDSSRLVVSGTGYGYDYDATEAWIKSYDTELNELWSHVYRDIYDNYSYYCGATTIAAAPASEPVIPLMIWKDSVDSPRKSVRMEFLSREGAVMDTVHLREPLASTLPKSMIDLRNGSVLFQGGSAYDELYELRLGSDRTTWTQSVEVGGSGLVQVGNSGFVRCGAIRSEQVSYLERYTNSGYLLWQTRVPEYCIQSIDVLGERIIFVASPWDSDDPQIILGSVDLISGVRQWDWFGETGYAPRLLNVTDAGEVLVAGTWESGAWIWVFLAKYQLALDMYANVAQLEPAPVADGQLGVSPNPFNNATTVSLSLDRMSLIDMTLYDLLGRPVRTLAQDQLLSAGEHRFAVDGAGLASGTYILMLDAGAAGVSSQRITLVK